MAKQRKKQMRTKRATAGQMVPARGARQVVPRSVLDKAALEWAALLRDPCNARLSYPCYPSGSGGAVLIRYEADYILSATATDTAMALLFTPGISSVLVNNIALPTDTTGFQLQNFGNLAPGNGFLSGNATSFRPVAGCAQISYPGTELTRSGIIGLGVIDGATVAANYTVADGGLGIVTSAAQMRTLCQHVERMPSTVSEVRWFPGERDAHPFSLNAVNLSKGGDSEGRNTLVVTASGFPVSTGVRVRLVCVYEVSFGSNNGQVSTVVPPVSNTTPSQLLRAMHAADNTWFLSSATKFARAAGTAISYAAAGAKAVSNFAAAVGPLLL